MATDTDLKQYLGNIDIYLFDQILKGRFTSDMKVLDAGCGSGRNLVYFLRNDYEIFGTDESEERICDVRKLAASLNPRISEDNFHVEAIEHMTFPDAYFDAVICNAVLHLAAHEEQFHAMLASMWRVLKPEGIFFARLTSDIGIEDRVQEIKGRRFHLPDGSDRFLVNLDMLLSLGDELGSELLDPIKTVNVQNKRCMTTWVLRKV